jgi:hypothetical protein
MTMMLGFGWAAAAGDQLQTSPTSKRNKTDALFIARIHPNPARDDDSSRHQTMAVNVMKIAETVEFAMPPTHQSLA